MLVLGWLGILHESRHLLSHLVSSHRRPGARIAWLGGRYKFEKGQEKFIYVNSRGARGHEKFIPVWIKRTRWRPKKIFSSKISTTSGYRLKILAMFHEFLSEDQKQKLFVPKVLCKPVQVHKNTSGKHQFSASICTPVAPGLLISSGHSPRLGRHNFRLGGSSSHLGGHDPGIPLRGAEPEPSV